MVDIKDITIIGGGPTSLAAAFRAGMHESSARIIEVAPQLGGQMTALYPEKYVYDVFGLPKILAKALSDIVEKIHGIERFEAVTIKSWKGVRRTIEADALLPMIGFKINLGPLQRWGLKLSNGKQIAVNSRMETNQPGVFAAGDMAEYPGKIKLIATGFAEAAIAVKSALEYIHPERTVRVPFSSVAGLPSSSRDRGRSVQPF